jgi:putative RNA 2'-phosphotransferase
MTAPLVKKSKYLSLILRHNPGKVNITLDEHGWVSIDILLKAIKWELQELSEVVENNDKKRFEFNEDKTKIRASQGHSIDVDLDYEIKTPPEFLYHGTSRDNIDSIRKSGLLRMSRHDVHMFDDYLFALDIAEKRRKNPVVLIIDAKEMVSDGYHFKLSTNNVWLTNTVLPKYLYDGVNSLAGRKE